LDLVNSRPAVQAPVHVKATTVSVIVPTRDRPHLLREALESIRALEGPDLKFEIIVGDNGDLAQTALIAESAGARHVDAKRGKGAGVARNAALAAATGEYIAFLDDDDRWFASHLRSHLELLARRPDIDAVTGQIVSADDRLRQVGAPWPAEPPGEGVELLRRMLSGYFPQIGSVVARASVRDTIGYFDETLIGGEDLDWLLRLARRNKLAVVQTKSVLFRGRPLGSYDQLQLDRSHYDRKVFLRHALPEWRIWKSPVHLWRAHYGTLKHFYRYFVDAAVRRSARGKRAAALQAIWFAFRVFPLRTIYHLFKWRRLRIAFLGAVLPRNVRGSEATITHMVMTMATMVHA